MGQGSEKLNDERGWGFSLLGDQAAIPYLFRTKRGRFEETIISNTVHWKSYPKYFVSLSHKIKK